MNKLWTLLLVCCSCITGTAQALSDGEYMIKVSRTGKYLAVEGAAQGNGAVAVQWDMEVSKHFLFIVKKLEGNLYSIQAKHSARYLSSTGDNPQEGAAVIQWDWLNQDNQKWIIQPAVNGNKGWTVRCYKNYMKLTLQYWNSSQATPGNGAQFRLTRDEIVSPVILDFKKNEANTGEQMRFKSDSQKAQTQALGNNYKPILVDVPDGIYKIRINETGKYLAIAGQEDYASGMKLIQWDMLPRNNHLFRVARLDNGNYSITALHSEKVLDVVDRRTDDGTQIQQWENLNGVNQQWKFYNAGNDHVKIVSVASGKFLSLSGANNNPNNGVPLMIASDAAVTFKLLHARANKFTEYITIRNMEIRTPKTDGDQSLFGEIRIYLLNKNGQSKGNYYLSPTNMPFNLTENKAYDISKSGRLSLPGEYKFSVSSDELIGAKIVIVYSINENDASVFTNFTSEKGIPPGGDILFVPDLEPTVSGGADDFYILKTTFGDCLKNVLEAGKFSNRQQFYVTDIPVHCEVHINMQEEDGSDNWLDVYYNISKERKN